jgi:hypothetical protein
MIHQLNIIEHIYIVKSSSTETISMGMCGNGIQSLKIMLVSKINETEPESKYLGYYNLITKKKISISTEISGKKCYQKQK